MELLTGVRVVDFTSVLSGPFCTFQLAQLGAEVIKIELPGSGDLARQLGANPDLNRRLMGTSFLAQNAGKRSVTVNLKSDAGKEIVRRLVARADVVVENFRPGVMERLGLGYEALCRIKPDLVYCAISGFGSDGPLRDRPAYDQIVQGISGLMSVTGDRATAPLRAGYPAADTSGGINAAFAIAAALYRCAKTGKGDRIDVSMLEATIGAMAWVVSNLLIGGVAPEPVGNENMTASPSGAFRTRDGLINIAANSQAEYVRLCELIGRADLAIDARYADREERMRRRPELRLEIERALAAKSAAEWVALLTAHGVAAGEVLSVPQVMAHPQTAERGFVKSVPGVPGVIDEVRVLRPGFRLASGDPAPRSAPPGLGADTDAVLEELGFSREQIGALRGDAVV